MGYIQLVEFATHNQGNTLDLVFTPSDEEGHPKDIVSCSQGSFISDHCSILFDLKIETKNATLQRISYRNLKHINNQQLSYTIRDAFANISFADMNVNEALDILEANITIALDKHAPMQSKLKKKQILTPWFDEELKNQRRKTKRTDEKWRKYKEQCKRKENIYGFTKIKKKRGNIKSSQWMWERHKKNCTNLCQI